MERIVFIQNQMNQSNFWDNSSGSNTLVKELKFLKSLIEPFEACAKRLKDSSELLEMLSDDASMVSQINEEVQALTVQINEIELKNILSGPFDRNNVILSINAGAGGTESCDWVGMLLRMYTRYAEKQGYKVKTLDYLTGDEAGVKNVTLGIEGEMAYGYLKAEKGVHRLVRISPFDSNKRRHTSFASVNVLPEIEDDEQIAINTEDLKIDMFRSSGPGGQSVNTTDSAVRITHIPTGIVTQSQNERSQLQNRQTAMKVLKAKLYELKRKEQDEVINKEQGEKQKIEWGSQIRSYVMHPYNMVKDHRTDAETAQVAKVMDGDLQMFIEAFLKMIPE